MSRKNSSKPSRSPDTVLDAFRQKFRRWLFRPKIEHGTVILTQRRIFMLPTKQGLALALLLILMLLGDINYSLSLGYVLTFLLAMMAVMSMLHAFRNLAHLQIHAGRTDPVFAGETARFLLHFNNPGKLARYQLALRNGNGDTISFDAAAGQSSEVYFPLPASHRGWLHTGRLTLYTVFPLGLFYTWSYLHFDTPCLIYAKPLDAAILPAGNATDGTGKHLVAGDDDFAGLRNYVAGDALPHIAWKAYARGLGLQVKQFASQESDELWLDLADAPDNDLEEKLSRLTRWVLDAESKGLRYGLRLSNHELAANCGTIHQDECLRRVALFALTAP